MALDEKRLLLDQRYQGRRTLASHEVAYVRRLEDALSAIIEHGDRDAADMARSALGHHKPKESSGG